VSTVASRVQNPLTQSNTFSRWDSYDVPVPFDISEQESSLALVHPASASALEWLLLN